MYNGKVAIPTEDANGVAGKRSDHFGHCPYFTIVGLENGAIKDVAALGNESHRAGGCQAVVDLLEQHRVNTVVASGMGNGPFMKLTSRGISVLFADKKSYPDVQSVLDGLCDERIQLFGPNHLCQGGGNCRQHGRQPA